MPTHAPKSSSEAAARPRLPQHFLLAWSALALSAAGDRLFFAAVAWFVTAQYGAVAGTLTVGLAQFLPSALLAPFAGVLVDRLPRHRLLVWSDAARLVTSLIFAGVLWWFGLSLVAVLVSVVALRVAGMLFQPALQSALATAAHTEGQLIRLDVWVLAAGMIAGLAGPGLAVLAVAVGAVTAMLINAGTFLLSLSAMIRAQPIFTRQETSLDRAVLRRALDGWWSSAAEGLAVVRTDTVVRRVVPTLPVIDLAAAGLTLLLPAVLLEHGYSSGVWYGVLTGTWAAGRFIGLFLTRRLLVYSRKGPVLALNAVVQGVAMLGIAMVDTPVAMVPLFLVIGIPSGCASVCVSAYIQTKVREEVRGRVFALLNAAVTAAMPLGPLVAGAVTAIDSVPVAIAVLGVALGVTGLIPLASRRVWRVA
ncbi:MFS transporter [Rhizohabitans arisaemae]|uniref:MFS transporter n=1 Tax=Rhizohabitans arisaemae TaxID=2720610 RepID=UPI0024B1C919|nr:MFS transporter [Rhizohabitans arisaemae]